MNEPNAYRLIKKLSGTEKAYFKKYAYKRKNAKNDSYNLIFNILDKYDDYQVKRITSNTKIDATLRKNIHATMNNLYTKLTETLIAYRKAKQKNKIFAYLEEEELLRELGLLDLAEKVMLKCRNYAEESRYYFLKPFVYDRYTKLLTNNITVNLENFDEQVLLLNKSIDQMILVQKINLISQQLERIIHVNGGVVVKNEDDYLRINSLLEDGLEVLPKCGFDFMLQSVLANNLLILDLMSKQQKFLDFVSESFILNFNEKIKAVNSYSDYTNASLVLKNLLVFSIYNNSEMVPDLIQKFEDLLQNTTIEDAKSFVGDRLLQSRLLNAAMSENCMIEEETLQQGIQMYLNNTKSLRAHVIESLVSILIILIQNNRVSQAIELSNNFIETSLNQRIRDEEISIKMLLAIAWHKKENIDLNHSITRSIYRNLLQHPSFPLQKEVLLFLKNLHSVHSKPEKIKERLKSLISQIDASGRGTEKMKARELERIAQLVF